MGTITLYLVCALFSIHMVKCTENKRQSGCSTAQVDIQFLLDSSGSIGSANFIKLKLFVAEFAKLLTIGPQNVQVGVATFSSKVSSEFSMNRYSSEQPLVSAINSIKYIAGGTNTGTALKWVDNNAFTSTAGNRPNVADILIVLTDGKSSNAQQTATAASTLHSHNVITFGIGIGNGVSRSELESIASNHQHVLTTPNFDTLQTLLKQLEIDACNAVLGHSLTTAIPVLTTVKPVLTTVKPALSTAKPNFCTSNPCQNGGRCLHDPVGYVCLCDGGFTGKNCENDICSTHPCNNNGRCLEDSNGYVCFCNSGFTGKHCETATSSAVIG